MSEFSATHSPARTQTFTAAATTTGSKTGMSSTSLATELQEIKEAMRRLERQTASPTKADPVHTSDAAAEAHQRASLLESHLSSAPATQSSTSFGNIGASLGLSAPGASSTKAVLSALRALQDKIRRLEHERQSAVDQCTNLKSKLQQTEIEGQRKLERELGAAQDKAVSQQHAYERLTSEKESYEHKIRLMEEEKKSLYREIEHLRERSAELELSRRSAEAKSNSHEARAAQLADDLKAAEEREARMAQLVSEEQADKHTVLAELQNQLADAEQAADHERGVNIELRSKLASAEDMLKNVMSINEYLVSSYAPSSGPKKKSSSSSTSRPVRHAEPRYCMPTRSSKIKSVNPSISTSSAPPPPQPKKKVSKSKKSSARAPFIPTSSGNVSHNLIAAVSEVMKKADDPSQMRVLSDLYAKLSAETDEETSSSPQRVTHSKSMTHSQAGPREFSQVVGELEKEFNDLNRRYKHLVALAAEGKSKHADELLNVIQQLQQKGHQLHLMRRGLDTPIPEKSPVVSPESSRKKAAALRILHDFRELSHDH